MKKYFPHFFFISGIFINLCVCDDSVTKTVQVKLKQGELSGKEELTLFKEQKYYSFQGIPYAEPPIGELRFRPPVSHQGWENVYEAHSSKPMCFQFQSKMRMGEKFGAIGSEDCLYINVFTPNIRGSAPVIVFDHNDNFKTSFNGTNTYSPIFFMEENVVVVTIGHRLELLGYLTTEDSVIPGNIGLKDFVMGLNWIQENIKEFGGDPNSVTVMGNRGGAIIANVLLYSEKAKNLFSGVILQSGTALETLFFNDDSRKKAFELGKLFNITASDSETLLTELQKLDVEDLYNKGSDLISEIKEEELQENIFSFGPVVENENPDAILTNLPDNSNIVNDVPIIIGMNSREGIDLISIYLFNPAVIEEIVQNILFLFPVRTDYRFNKKSDAYTEAIKEIVNFYFEEGYFYSENILEYSVYIGDMLQNFALNRAAKQLAKKSQSPVYYYLFDFWGLLNENMMHTSKNTRYTLKPWGATIGDELCYLHLCSRIKDTYNNFNKLKSPQFEIKVLKKMVRLWSNFARTRNPTPSKEDDVLKGFKWLPISKANYDTNYLHITKTLSMDVNPLGEREKFWDNFLEKYSKLAVDGIVQNKRDEL